MRLVFFADTRMDQDLGHFISELYCSEVIFALLSEKLAFPPNKHHLRLEDMNYFSVASLVLYNSQGDQSGRTDVTKRFIYYVTKIVKLH